MSQVFYYKGLTCECDPSVPSLTMKGVDQWNEWRREHPGWLRTGVQIYQPTWSDSCRVAGHLLVHLMVDLMLKLRHSEPPALNLRDEPLCVMIAAQTHHLRPKRNLPTR